MDQLDTTPALEDSNDTNLGLGTCQNITSPKKLKGLPKGVSGNDLGRGIHRVKQKEFEALKPNEQNEALRTIWKSIAVGVAERAKSFSTTCSPKDFGKLYQLVQTGAVAIDRAFPPKQEIQSPKLIFNLFNSLGQRATRIAVPIVPEAIDVQSKTLPDSETVSSPSEEGGAESRSSLAADSGEYRPVEDPREL